MKAFAWPGAAAGLLLAAALAPAGDNAPSAPKPTDELQKIRAGLTAPHQNLLDLTVAKAQADQAAEAAAKKKKDLQDAVKALREAEAPPPPEAPKETPAERDARLAPQKAVVDNLRAEVKGFEGVEEAKKQADDALKDFQSKNPGVELPKGVEAKVKDYVRDHPAAPPNDAAAKLNKGGLKYGDSPTRDEAGKILKDQSRYDTKGPAKDPVDVRKQSNPNDPFPDPTDRLRDAPGPATPKPDPGVERERKWLDTEAAALEAEGNRLTKLREDLNNRAADLAGRIDAHNRNKPDPTNELAVRAYNAEADRLDRERSTLKAEDDRLVEAGKQLLQRLDQFTERAAKFSDK
jgi:hypothetical protein